MHEYSRIYYDCVISSPIYKPGIANTLYQLVTWRNSYAGEDIRILIMRNGNAGPESRGRYENNKTNTY